MFRPDSFPRRKSPLLLLNLGKLLSSALRVWRKKQQNPESHSMAQAHTPWTKYIRKTKVKQGQKGREISFIHVKNSIYLLDLNVGMVGSKMIKKPCNVEQSSVPKAVTHT